MPAREARETATLALPITLGSAGQILMNVVDSLMIGAVGTVPLAASAFSGGVFGFFYVTSLGLLFPISVFGARARPGDGEGPAWLRHGLVIATLTGLGGCLLMLGLSPWLAHFDQPAEVLQIARPFYSLLALSLIPAMLHQGLRQYSEARGHPWLPMWITLGGVLLNAALNWILIYGRLGAPALGLTGAGLATLLSRWVVVGALALALHRRHSAEHGWPEHPLGWFRKPEAARLREMLALGIPSSIQLLFEVCAFTAAAVMMGWLGTKALAAHQIALSCVSLTFMFPLGLAMATSIRVSGAVGAGDTARVRKISFSAVLVSAACMGLFALCFLLFGRHIAGFFVQDAAVAELAARLLVIAAVFQLFDGTQVVCGGALRGLGDVKVPTLITALAYWGLAVPASYLLGVRVLGPDGVWWGMAAGLAFAALALLWRLARRTRA